MDAVGRLSDAIDLMGQRIVGRELGVAGPTIALLAQNNTVHTLEVSVSGPGLANGL